MTPLAKERLNPISSDRDFTEGGPRHKIQVEKNPQDLAAYIFLF